MKYLIAGLGNIGAEYETTRHNIGFLVLDYLAQKKDCGFSSGRYADVAETKHRGRSLTLIKPTTYMNLSGKALRYWMNELKVNKQNMLVITDDLSLPFGKLRMRKKGSSAGHNGLKSIEENLGGSDYPRLKFGIGDDFNRGNQVDYVLSPFTQEEFNGLDPLLERSAEMILSFVSIGADRTMSQFND